MRFSDFTVLVPGGICLAVHKVARGVASCLPRRFYRLATIALIGGLMVAVTPIRVSAQPLHWWVADVLEGIRERMDEDGSILSHGPLTGTLDAGESASIQVHTCSGIQYTAQGICDLDCTDFDLTAYDSSGNVLDSDVSPGDIPVLVFTPAVSGITALSVEMVSCTDSCDWGVQLFFDDATAPHAPGAGDGGASNWPANRDRYLGTYRGPGGDTTILRHEGRLTVLFPAFQRESGGIGVLRPTGSTHVFRLESDGSRTDGDRVLFVVNDAGQVTSVFFAGQESRRVE